MAWKGVKVESEIGVRDLRPESFSMVLSLQRGIQLRVVPSLGAPCT